MIDIDREESLWQVLNIVMPSEKKRFRDGPSEYVLPFTDERINTIFPKGGKTKKGGDKNKSNKKAE